MPKPKTTLSGLPDGAQPSDVIRGSRRQFLQNAAGAGMIMTIVPACQKICDIIPGHDPDNKTVDLGSGDTGIMNYCYMLQQLEAAFYSKVVQNPFQGIREYETANFISVHNHEIAHREFYKNLLSHNAIQKLDFKFKTIDFKEREVVLQSAKIFEDLIVAAYNGILSRIVDQKLSLSNAKVLSVDARHAAVMAELDLPGSFAGSVGVNGVDPAWRPSQVMAVAQLYIVQKINFQGISF